MFTKYINNRCTIFEWSSILHTLSKCPWDIPRYLPRWISLLKLFPWYQIIPPLPINKNVFDLGHNDTLPPVNFEKISSSHWNRVSSSMVVGLWTNSTTWHLKFSIKSSAMNTGYLVSLVIHLYWSGFLEKFLGSSSLQ